MFSFCCKNKHKLLTLISFSLLYSVAAALGFHSRSVPSSFFLHTTLFIFLPALLLKLISNLVCDGFCPIVLSPSLLILNCAGGKKMLLSRSAQQVTHECTHCFPPPLLRFSIRLSDLSLRSMHPSPVPDAEAHGEDGNNRPEQLYFPNGEVSRSFPFTFTQTCRRCLLSAFAFFCSDAGISVLACDAVPCRKTTC